MVCPIFFVTVLSISYVIIIHKIFKIAILCVITIYIIIIMTIYYDSVTAVIAMYIELSQNHSVAESSTSFGIVTQKPHGTTLCKHKIISLSFQLTQAYDRNFFVCIIYPQYKYAYVQNYSAHGHELSGCVLIQMQTRIYNLILISASYYYAPCMALALVLYCV